jgi:CheY-like chemotaxis protein
MKSANKGTLNSILLVDDEPGSLKLYSHLLKEELAKAGTVANIVSVRHPTEALRLANDHLFDVILIDITINYNGTPFGGMELYNSLLARYGDASLIAYSQLVTDDLLKQYGHHFNFIERGNDHMAFAEALHAKMLLLREKQSCFVAMPFDKKYDDVFEVIQAAVGHSAYRCVRVDKQVFTESIVAKIFEEIENAKLIIFLATGHNPNVFYESGYALALKKEIITIAEKYRDLPFDIRDRNAITHGKNMKLLTAKLEGKLRNLGRVE